LKPDVIVARGGFREYVGILARHRKAKKFYYGAGKRMVPADGIKYDGILCDSPEQKAELEARFPDTDIHLFIKPAADNVFFPMDVEKEHDACYVAVLPEDKRKKAGWVYKTVPEDIRVLQLGHYPKGKPPSNVKVKQVGREQMCKRINQCIVGIVPYTEEDSCPRIIPEMLACGIPVVTSEKVHYWDEKYEYCYRAAREDFWGVVRATIKQVLMVGDMNSRIRQYYLGNLSVKVAAAMLRGILTR
jgi:hypothetical protein